MEGKEYNAVVHKRGQGVHIYRGQGKHDTRGNPPISKVVMTPTTTLKMSK